MSSNDPPRTIKSVETACRLIEALRSSNGSTVTALANELNRSPGTVSTYLTTLQKYGIAVEKNQGYDLGPEFLTLGEYVRHHSVLYQAAKEEVDHLVEETGECGHLIIEHKGQIYALYETFGDNAVGVEYHNRKREVPLSHIHCTAAGKAILANIPENQAKEILADKGLAQNTANTITDIDHLLEQLATIREQGFAFADEEQMHGIRAVGAPIKMANGEVAGAIAISGPTTRLKDSVFREEFPEYVTHAANVAEVNLETSDKDLSGL